MKLETRNALFVRRQKVNLHTWLPT